MSTDKAVRDAIAGAEIGEARPAVTGKRPWTGGKHPIINTGGICYVGNIAMFSSEADARLFAAADGLYDMLQDYVCQHGCDCGHPSCSECKRTREAREKLRAANPAAFESEGE